MIHAIVRAFSCLTALLMIALAVCHFYNAVDSVSLLWEDCDNWGQDSHCFIAETTYAWRRVFSFVPATLFDIWTPAIFAILSISQHISGMQMLSACASYARSCLFHIIMALWGAFGYCGNFGICVGSVSLITAFLAFLGHFLGKGENPSYQMETNNPINR